MSFYFRPENMTTSRYKKWNVRILIRKILLPDKTIPQKLHADNTWDSQVILAFPDAVLCYRFRCTKSDLSSSCWHYIPFKISVLFFAMSKNQSISTCSENQRSNYCYRRWDIFTDLTKMVRHLSLCNRDGQ